MKQPLDELIKMLQQANPLSAGERALLEDTLKQQQRELDIEASLEKVRAIALGMNQPADMLEICKTISKELTTLGVKAIRNVQTAIFHEEKEIYLNFEYYSKHDKTVFTETEYRNHPLHNEFAQQMLKGAGEVFIRTISKKELPDWITYQKTTNVFIDSFLESASSLTYYWHSLGPVALGMSTYELLHEEEIALFRRFRNVFELSYRRYLDIEKAETQAREAQIETSLERVRAVALGMRTPDDLLNICETLFHELLALGFSGMRNAMINIHNDEKKSFINYDFSDEIGRSTNHLTYTIHPLVEKQIKKIRSANDAFSETYFTGKDLEEWKKFRKLIGEKDDPRLNQNSGLYYYFYSIGIGSIGISTFGAISDEKIAMLKRFRNVFHLSYQRYTDIAKAEAQAKEARLEASLEKVRAQSMAMHTTAELKTVGETIYHELRSLGFADIRNTEIIINKDEQEAIVSYYCDYGVCGTIEIGYKANPILQQWANDLKKASDAFVPVVISEKEMPGWRKFREEIGYLPDEKLNAAASVYYYSWSTGLGALSVSSFAPVSEEQMKMLARFRNVFALAYRRYVDVALAETQAREAQIELALERVRARTMAMQRSDELREVIQTVYEQLVHLSVDTDHTGFILDYKERDDFHSWIADQFGTPSEVTIPYFDCIYYNRFKEAKEKGTDFFATTLNLEEKNSFYRELFKHVPGFPEESKKIIFSHPGFSISTVLLQDVALYIENFTGIPYSEDDNDILKRFGKVFQQTYTRFLDLRKAEAQARESQIELALERVRARTMAMQRSDELIATTAVLFEQFRQLGENVEQISIGIFGEEENTIEVSATYHASPLKRIFKAHINDWPLFEQIYTLWKSGAKSGSVELKGKELHDYNRYRSELSGTQFGNENESPDDRWIINIASFSKGIISFSKDEPAEEETIQLLERFAKVFDLTYTRFLDLQKAEAQAHEAQIEASLERVRASAMAMHNSDDLTGAAGTVFTELNKLGIHTIRSGFVLLTRESRRAKLYPATSFDKAITLSFTGEFDFIGHPVFEQQYESWLKQENYFPVLEGETLVSYYRMLSEALAVSFDQYLKTDKQFGSFLPFTDGFLFTWGTVPASTAETAILTRFKTILDLTIRRYADLKKAEALVAQSLIEERKLREEKERADKLLLNILPAEIAEELKQFGKSYARKHDEVTILFADIKGFSSIAETLSAQELVTQLDECFRAFDHIVDKHGLEKIKTVGDAYVCACGLPNPVADHATKTIRAALDMMNFIRGFSITRTIQDLPAFDFRIGIHTGPVVTGVVGLKKFTYDIWGDAVNMAARMEQHGEAGKINISESTHTLVKDKFKCTARGKIPAKNKGEVEMYFVEDLR
ncbi:MAG: adenylate/guanylate cyclase domain-containing protein [Chitinophagales bacterium]|nr:adenylate/guanylate cyclase domain-containing protein [Chitinophagales bacterium]